MLAKAVLLSTLIGMIVIPALLAREANPRRGYRKVLLLTFVFNLAYWLAVRFVYPRLL
jgi:hypothetical protein